MRYRNTADFLNYDKYTPSITEREYFRFPLMQAGKSAVLLQVIQGGKLREYWYLMSGQGALCCVPYRHLMSGLGALCCVGHTPYRHPLH